MNVDDEEYEEFLNAEFNNEDKSSSLENGSKSKNGKQDKRLLSKTEQQKLIDELAFPSTNENLDNCKVDSTSNEAGWQNLFNQTQQEIQELKMRAEGKADSIKVHVYKF